MKNKILYIISALVIAISASAQDIVVKNADSIWRSSAQAPEDVKPIEPRVIVNYANSLLRTTLNKFPDQLTGVVSQVGSKFIINNANATFWQRLEPMNPAIVGFSGIADGTDVKLTWTNKRASEFPKAIIVYSKDRVLWRPSDGSKYQLGKEVANGQIVGFMGEGTNAIVSGLKPETVYNFAIFGYNDASLEYSLPAYASVKTGAITIKAVKGDVNNDGQIRSNDAIMALRISAGLKIPSSEEFWAADMNNDGKVMANDAILILRKAAGFGAPSIIAKDKQMLEISLPEVSALASETIIVPIRVNSIDVISGGDICIAYDSKVLKVIDVSCDMDLLLESNMNVPGEVHISFANNDRISDNMLAKIKFEVLSDSASALRFQKTELYYPDGVPVNLKKTHGKFWSLAMPPERTELLQNYPNPFNPDTWIPFQLNRNCHVKINIYDISGKLVRSLDLGNKDAGVYTSKDRAAYWDGCNNSGEKVASGVYFYQLQAGSFTSVKKLLIIK